MIFDKIYPLEKAYVIPLVVMKCGGGWQLDTKIKWKKALYFIYSFFALFSYYSIAVINMIVIYKVLGDLHELIETLCVFVFGIFTMMKHAIIIIHASKIKAMNNELENNLFSIELTSQDEEEQERLTEARRRLMYIFKIFSFLTFPILGFQLLYPILDEPERRRFPTPYWLPFDIRKSPTFEIFYTYIAVIVVIFSFVIVGVDTLLYGILLRIHAQFEVLRLQFEKLGRCIRNEMPAVDNYGLLHVADKRQYIVLTLKGNFRYHQELLRVLDSMMDVFSWSLFLHLTAVSVQICIVLVEAMKTKNDSFTIQQLQRIPFCGGILFDTWIFCLLGTWIEDQSKKLSEEAYDLPWYDLDSNCKRMLLIFMTRADKLAQLNAGYTVPLNLQYFLSILNASYSFFSVVRQTID